MAPDWYVQWWKIIPCGSHVPLSYIEHYCYTFNESSTKKGGGEPILTVRVRFHCLRSGRINLSLELAGHEPIDWANIERDGPSSRFVARETARDLHPSLARHHLTHYDVRYDSEGDLNDGDRGCSDRFAEWAQFRAPRGASDVICGAPESWRLYHASSRQTRHSPTATSSLKRTMPCALSRITVH